MKKKKLEANRWTLKDAQEWVQDVDKRLLGRRKRLESFIDEAVTYLSHARTMWETLSAFEDERKEVVENVEKEIGGVVFPEYEYGLDETRFHLLWQYIKMIEEKESNIHRSVLQNIILKKDKEWKEEGRAPSKTELWNDMTYLYPV